MTGQQLKLQGMGRAAAKHATELEFAQIAAYMIGKSVGEITIEDVRRRFADFGYPWTLGNAAGSVFDNARWECVGYTTAKRPEAHGRVIRVWRLK